MQDRETHHLSKQPEPVNFVDGEAEAEDSRRGRAVEDSLAVDMIPFHVVDMVEPTCRNHLLPDKNDDTSIQEAARLLSLAIHHALSSTVKARAAEFAERILLEDGVSEAIKHLKEELGLN
ncbi:hypothetical protein ACSQ67_013295 [Phaseolus vulgaris]